MHRIYEVNKQAKQISLLEMEDATLNSNSGHIGFSTGVTDCNAAPRWLDSLVGGEVRWFRKGHGFKFCSSHEVPSQLSGTRY